MEFFIVMISVPLFLLVVLLLSVFVLAKYPYRQSAEESHAEGSVSEVDKGSASETFGVN